MSMNHPQELFAALKRGVFPTASGEMEKMLRIAFFQGMHSGIEVSRQVLTNLVMTENQIVDTFHDIKLDLAGALADVGQQPGKIDVGLSKPKNGVKFQASIDGEPIKPE